MLKRSIIFAVLACVGNSIAPAATVVYTNRDAFFAMLAPGSFTEGFLRPALPYPPAQIPSPRFFPGDETAFSFSAASSQGLFMAGTPSDPWLSNAIASNPITFTITSGNPYAVGGFFFITDTDGKSVGATLATLLVQVNDGTSFLVPPNSNPETFVGFISDVPILSLTLTRFANGGTNDAFATVDDFTLGHIIPEPGSVLLVLGAGACALGRRRVCDSE
jgi:hypothetical protein